MKVDIEPRALFTLATGIGIGGGPMITLADKGHLTPESAIATLTAGFLMSDGALRMGETITNVDRAKSVINKVASALEFGGGGAILWGTLAVATNSEAVPAAIIGVVVNEGILGLGMLTKKITNFKARHQPSACTT